MKTKEQIKNEIIRYLNETSKHTFNKPTIIDKWGENGHYYDYDYEKIEIFKIVKIDDNFYKLDKSGLRKINIDSYVNSYKNNAKNVLKHQLFLNKGMVAIKNTKQIKNKIEDMKNLEIA